MSPTFIDPEYLNNIKEGSKLGMVTDCLLTGKAIASLKVFPNWTIIKGNSLLKVISPPELRHLCS